VTRAVAAIERGLQKKLYVGNMDAVRDWGHARDYVEGMWRVLQQEVPDDYILATGVKNSVRKFVELAFAEVGVRIQWNGSGVAEKGVDAKSGRVLVEVDPRYFRPTEVDLLIGDPSKAERVLGWKATTSLGEMVREMVQSDLKVVVREYEHRRLDEEHDRTAAQ
jgi:GDPmannose 4,6-dehydratase